MASSESNVMDSPSSSLEFSLESNKLCSLERAVLLQDRKHARSFGECEEHGWGLRGKGWWLNLLQWFKHKKAACITGCIFIKNLNCWAILRHTHTYACRYTPFCYNVILFMNYITWSLTEHINYVESSRASYKTRNGNSETKRNVNETGDHTQPHQNWSKDRKQICSQVRGKIMSMRERLVKQRK